MLAYLKKPHVQSSQNFLCMLCMAVIQSVFDDSAVCYVLLVLWMTSCLPIIGHAEVMPIGRTVRVTYQGWYRFHTAASIVCV